MTFRRRLGVLATAVSGLLVTGLLLSAPAFAWNAEITRLEAACPPGSEQINVTGTVTLEPSDDSGKIQGWYRIGETGDFTPDETETFSPGQKLVDFHFSVPSPDSDTTITVKAVTFFDHLPEGEQPPTSEKTIDLEKCKGEDTTTTTTVTPTTAAPTTAPPTTAPPTTAPPTTAPPTTAALGKAATTVGASGLPRTGSNAVPMLIAALVLVVGGAGLLVASRFRSRRAK